MLKNILVTLFIIPVIGTAIYGYFYFKQIKTPVSPVIQAIPVNAAVIVKCNNAKSMLQNFSMSNPAWKSLADYPSFGEMHREIKKLDALFPLGSEALKNIQDNPLFISAHPIGSSGFECLFLTNLPNTVTKKYVDAFVKNSASKETVFNLKIYDGIALNELKISETSSFFYFFSRGIFACSFSQMLMEDAIRQLNSGVSISTDMAFEKVWNAAGKKVDATIFVNYEYLSQTINAFVNQKESQFIKPLASFANWTSLDVKWKATTIQ